MGTDGGFASDHTDGAAAGPNEPLVPEVARGAVEQGLARFDLTVLPKDLSQSGKFVYDEATSDLVKELRSLGVDAGFAHDSDERLFYSERSADIAVAFVINLASAAVWQAFLVALDAYRARKKLTVTLVHDKHPNGGEHKAASFDGDGATVIEALRTYLDSERST